MGPAASQSSSNSIGGRLAAHSTSLGLSKKIRSTFDLLLRRTQELDKVEQPTDPRCGTVIYDTEVTLDVEIQLLKVCNLRHVWISPV